MTPRVWAVIAGIGYLVLLRAAPAAEHPVDPDLLEFLGSVDSQDKDWHDYLAHTDIDKVAKRAGTSPPAPPPPVAPAQPPASSGVPSPPKPPVPPPQVSQP